MSFSTKLSVSDASTLGAGNNTSNLSSATSQHGGEATKYQFEVVSVVDIPQAYSTSSSSSSSSSSTSSSSSSSSSAHPIINGGIGSWPSFLSKEAKEAGWWLKWGLTRRVSVATVRIGGGRKFDPSEAGAFLVDLFNSQALRESLIVHSSADKRGAKGVKLFSNYITTGSGSSSNSNIVVASSSSTATAASSAPLVVSRVKYQALRTTVTSLSFFDRLVDEAKVVTGEGGYIRKRLDEEMCGITVSDLLRQAFLDPDGINHMDDGSSGHDFQSLYSNSERNELIYRIMKWIVTGGEVCQFEDTWQPYLDAVKALYRDLVTVIKTPGTSDGSSISVASHVYSVQGLEGQQVTAVTVTGSAPNAGSTASTSNKTASLKFFPDSDTYDHSVCWVSVDPIRRTASVLYHAWVPFW